MERGKMSSSGRGGKSKAPQHPQDIFALGTKSTVVVSRDAEKRNIHKASTSGVERKRETTAFGSQPPNKRPRIGSPAEAVGGTSLEIDPVDLVPNVLQALDTHNSDKLLGLLTGSIRLLKSQRSKPDPILCMGLLYLTKIRPNMFAHETVTNTLCTLLKREQGAAFKNKGNPLVFVLACNMLYAGHRESNSWPDVFIKVYIEDALNERWWVECAWCKCFVENITTAFGTKQPSSHLIPTDNTLGTMSPSGSGSPLMGSTEEETDNTDLEYSVLPRYANSLEAVEATVLEAIKDQIQRRSAAPDAIGKGFLKLLAATCGFSEIRMISAARLEAWLNSGKLWRVAQELLAYVCVNCDATGASAARDHEVLAQLARMRLKTKPLQAAYQACLRDMTADSPALLRSVVTHTVYNELSNVRSPNNTGVLAALGAAQPAATAAALGETFLELAARGDEWARALRALAREVTRALRAEAGAALPALARALAAPPEPAPEARERTFAALADLQACLCLLAAAHVRPDPQPLVAQLQAQALGWLLDTAEPCYRPSRQDFQLALNKIMFVESADVYSKVDNWPPESERALLYRLCCEAPLPQNNLLRIIFIGLSKEIPVTASEVFELVETLVRRACALPPEDNPLQVDKLEVAEYMFQLCQFSPPENMTLPAGYTPPPLAITSLYWRAWVVLVMLAAHNPHTFAERAAATYPTLRALIETCITNKPSVEWSGNGSAEAEAERAAILQLESHLAAASSGKAPVTEASSRLLSQLCALEPLGPARRPPAAVLEALAALAHQLRLGKLLCRQPALLVALVERHGTRRAMPWLHQLLRQEQLQLSVLPVQCLCEFLAAGGGEQRGPELRRHLRHTLHAAPDAARAVLHYYTQRLAHHHHHTRLQASRGLKLVLSENDDVTEQDYNADVSPEEWLELLWGLRQWAVVRAEVVCRLRAACLVECVPRHVAAYIAFLAAYTRQHPDEDHDDLVQDLSQVMMERTAVMNRVLGWGDAPSTVEHHRALHALTSVLYDHLQKVRASPGVPEAEAEAGAWGGERVALQWAPGRVHALSLLVVHAHLKLLCFGPSLYDAEQAMHGWLLETWVGAEAPTALGAGADALLPDWLRLQLVRSARPALLAAALRGLPAHKLALFIQTFGMPVPAMSALLAALDACPAGAVVRLSVERGYMCQLLRVQRARGATGGQAFAAALALQPVTYPPDDNLFAEEPLPLEPDDEWEVEVEETPLPLERVPALLAAVFGDTAAYPGDVDSAFIELIQLISSEASPGAPRPYSSSCRALLPALAPALAARAPAAAVLLRALLPHTDGQLAQLANNILSSSKCILSPLREALEAHSTAHTHVAQQALVTQHATKEQLVALLESATPSSLEEIGNNMIETQHPRLVVDVITHILENNQDGHYESKIKSEDGSVLPGHVFSSSGRGCGLLLDWLAELQPETITDRQLSLMFGGGGCAWRSLAASALAHRASWRALHRTLHTLLSPTGEWWPSSVLEFATTLCGAARAGPGRAGRAHAADAPGLSFAQLEALVRYIVRESRAGGAGAEARRRRLEARLPLVLRCAAARPHLLAAALSAARHDDLLLVLLYMKVPKIRQLMAECESRPLAGGLPRLGGGPRGSTAAADRVSHAALTALPQHHNHNKDLTQKAWRLEGGVRAVWARVAGAGARALPLAAALLRGSAAPHYRHHHYLLSPIEALPDDELFADENSAEVHSILECFIVICCGGGGVGSGALAHRVCALLRRYLCARPQAAQALLHKHQHVLAGIPALSGLVVSELGAPASALPPPHALLTLQRRADTPAALLYAVQELESWGVRRGGGWGGAESAHSALVALGPLAAHAHAALRTAALQLLTKLLPAAPDPKPGVRAILECLDSPLPDVTQSAVDKLPDLIVGMQEHATTVLMKVFELGVKSRVPVDTCLAKCVTTINMQRGC